MTDYYLTDKSRLNAQPKRTIGDYIESQGLLVPRRFDTLKEAQASGLPILCRSEHVQDYDGVSGLLPSPTLREDLDTNHDDELKKMIIEKEQDLFNREGIESGLQVYCGLLGLPLEKIKQEISFSYWEKIPGASLSVVADSAITGLYHVFTSFEKKKKNYSQVEGSRVITKIYHPLNAALPPGIEMDLLSLIQSYEKIRQLPHFEPTHCPIMEFIRSDDKNYFVQYHRTRDFAPADFVLKRHPEKEEVEAFAVRGCTSQEGVSAAVTLIYPYGKKKSAWALPPLEEGSFDFHINSMFSELLVRRRRMQSIATKNIGNFWIRMAATDHYSLSRAFKPEISVFFDYTAILGKEENEEFWRRSNETGERQTINLHLTSDGRKAYVKRV